MDSELAVTKEYTTEEIDESLEIDRNMDSECKDNDTPNDTPHVEPPSNKEVMEMTSKILLPSAHAPQLFLNLCDSYASCHGIVYNTKKTVCMCVKEQHCS